MFKLYLQYWEESEVGWGQRPDGYSLHLNIELKNEFINDYWTGMPSTVPEVYSRPCGICKETEVTKELYDLVKCSKNGCRFFENEFKNHY